MHFKEEIITLCKDNFIELFRPTLALLERLEEDLVLGNLVKKIIEVSKKEYLEFSVRLITLQLLIQYCYPLYFRNYSAVRLISPMAVISND